LVLIVGIGFIGYVLEKKLGYRNHRHMEHDNI